MNQICLFHSVGMEMEGKKVLETQFLYLKVKEVVAPYSYFSSLDFQMDNWVYSSSTAFVPLSSIINTEKFKRCLEENVADVQGACKKFKELIYDKVESEASVILHIADALTPLCTSIVTDRPCNTLSPIVTSDAIGLGTKDTWHGSPDMRIQAKEKNSIDVLVQADDAMPSGVCAPEPVYLEGKTNMDSKENRVRSQVVGITVVASFTNYNLTQQQEPMVPVLLICKRKVCVCIYHCTSDILLFTEAIQLDDVGVPLIWCMLHFR